MHIKKLTSSVDELVCSRFVIYFGFLFVIVINQSAQERSFTLKVLKAFFFHSLYLSSQFIFFTQFIIVMKASICYKDYLTTGPLHGYCINTLTPSKKNTVKMLLKIGIFKRNTFV